MKIIYPKTPNGLMVVMPAPCGMTIEEIARKDVPYGKPYLIVEDSDLPGPLGDADAWSADFSNPHGVGLGPNRWFIEQAQLRIADAIALANPEPPCPPEADSPRAPADDAPEEEVAAFGAVYAAYQAQQSAYQAALAAHGEVVQQLADRKALIVAESNATIALMKAEVLQFEGVVL